MIPCPAFPFIGQVLPAVQLCTKTFMPWAELSFFAICLKMMACFEPPALAGKQYIILKIKK
jgi:hypothetical protein